ncbi:hypothetical protein NTE05_005254 [Vibrio harveyi]|nr:hypothetical protein [Vibrio harveyi]
MELKDNLSIAISLLAIVISLVTLIRMRRYQEIVVKQQFLEQKYEFLTLAQSQQVSMSKLIYRIEKLYQTDALFKRDIYLVSKHEQLKEFIKTSDERIEFIANISYKTTNSELELSMREGLGLLKERVAILKTISHEIHLKEALDES